MNPAQSETRQEKFLFPLAVRQHPEIHEDNVITDFPQHPETNLKTMPSLIV